jgi:hypothetical protein
MARKGGYLNAILRDVVAFANTNGGTLYVGAGSRSKKAPVGVDNPAQAKRTLTTEIDRAVVPPIDVDVDVLQSGRKNVLRVAVPRGASPPYALNGTDIYVRQEAETSRAIRDEIVQLVRQPVAVPEGEEAALPELSVPLITHPRTGVEIVEAVERKGTTYYTLKDLRNGNVVQNVTRASSRKLWRYAITEYEDHPVDLGKVEWRGSIGLWKSYRRAGRQRYDLLQRDGDGSVHYYYGVTEDGIHGPWRQFVKEAQ